MRPITLFAAAAALFATVQTASAQTPKLALELRGGYAVPSGDWNDEEIFENGFGGGGTITAMINPRMGVYAGWEMFQFPLDEEKLGVDAEGDGTDAGFRVGLASFIPIAQYPSVTPFTELGVIYNTFEISASDGGVSAGVESEWGLGYEATVGVGVQVAPQVDLTPSLRFRSHNVEFEDVEGSDTVEYFTLGVGLRLRL